MIATRFSTPAVPLQFIIVDLGPTVDDINMGIVMSSDYVLPPVFADYFSTCSVYGLLNEVLPGFLSWREDHHGDKFKKLPQKDQDSLEEDGYYSFMDPEWPKLLPFLVQQYNLEKTTTQVEKTKGQGEQVEQVKADFVYSIRYLIDDLPKEGDDQKPGYPHKLLVPACDGHHAVTFCKNLVVAPALSHTTGVPLVHLADKGTLLMLTQCCIA